MELNKILELARVARDNDDSENAIRYYDMVCLENPNSWEAAFYIAYFKAKSTALSTQISKTDAEKFEKSIVTVVDLVDNELESDDEKEKVLLEIIDKSFDISIAMSSSIFDLEYRYEKDGVGYTDVSILHNAILAISSSLGDKIHDVFRNNPRLGSLATLPWKHCHSTATKEKWFLSSLFEKRNKIRIYEPDFEKEEEESEKRKIENKQKPISQKLEELKNLTVICEDYFPNDADELTSIDIPDNIEIIESDAFNHCFALKHVIFSENSKIKTIQSNAFRNTSLKSIIFGGKKIMIESNAFDACYELEKIDFSKVTGAVTIGDSACYDCTSLKSVIFGGSKLTIGKSAFEECTYLEKVDFRKVTEAITIKAYAFNECGNLSTVIFNPQTVVESIGLSAFGETDVKELVVNAKKIAKIFGENENSRRLIIPLHCDCEYDDEEDNVKVERLSDIQEVEKAKERRKQERKEKEEQEKREKQKENLKKCYLSLMVFKYMEHGSKDDVSKFHVNQGLILFFWELLAIPMSFIPSYGTIISLAMFAIAFIFSVRGVKGINKDKQYRIPLIGRIKLINIFPDWRMK